MSTPFFLLTLLLHPFHFTSAEVEWNPTTARVEVALRVSGNDLEQEIERDTRERIRIRKEMPEREQKRLASYIGRHFYLAPSPDAKPGEGETSRLKWIGTEDDSGWTWLYFELVPPAEVPQLWLTNRLFLDAHPTHVNHVAFLSAGKRQTLQCSRRNRSIRFPFQVDAPRE